MSPFAKLWQRRTAIALPDGVRCDLLSLPDLVQAKKTQRDKDWPMIWRLMEAHYFQHREKPTSAHIKFWLRGLRTPELLIEVTQAHADLLPGDAVIREFAGGSTIQIPHNEQEALLDGSPLDGLW